MNNLDFLLSKELDEKNMQILEDYYVSVQNTEKYYERDRLAAIKI